MTWSFYFPGTAKKRNNFSPFLACADLLTEPSAEPKWAIQLAAGGISNCFNPVRMLPAELGRPQYASLPNLRRTCCSRCVDKGFSGVPVSLIVGPWTYGRYAAGTDGGQDLPADWTRPGAVTEGRRKTAIRTAGSRWEPSLERLA